MSSSISSSDAWRRFFWLTAGTAAIAAGIVYAFVVLVDPFNMLPLSPPADRVPVASNARFAFPSLARSARFDSAIFGTSTSRMLRPVVLNPEFGARFANLSMNDATAYEQMRLFTVFKRAHPDPKVVMVGLDSAWCETGPDYDRLTFRAFPEWMYHANLWNGYREMFNLYSVQSAGQEFGVLIGIKAADQGRDGFTSFVPPDNTYDVARAAAHLRAAGPRIPGGTRTGDPSSWQFPDLELLRAAVHALPPATHKLLYFVPYNRVFLSEPGSAGAMIWDECKRRVVSIAAQSSNTLVVDFMRPSPITNEDLNYWDPAHYRIGTADRLARDLAAAARGATSDDYLVLESQ